jgi:hypothetical protein
MNWALVSFWLKQPEDEEKVYQQRTRIVSPDGQSGAEAVVDFEMKARSHRNTVKVFGFPIAQPGEYFATLSIRETGETEWNDVATYPIRVEHIAPQ